VGRFLGRLHAGLTRPAGLPSYPRDRDWLERQAHAVLPSLPYLRQRLLRDGLAEVHDLLSREDVARLPTVVIHGDLFRDNVLFNHLGLSGVLDFHHAAHGYRIYDLAVAANDWCVDSAGVLEPGRLRALVSAYAAIRPLEPAELWHLPMFMLYGGLAFWLSRLVVAFEHRQGRADRAKDPEVFARIVAERRANPVCLDPCLVNQRMDGPLDR
jgi:homoserine kinase type II